MCRARAAALDQRWVGNSPTAQLPRSRRDVASTAETPSMSGERGEPERGLVNAHEGFDWGDEAESDALVVYSAAGSHHTDRHRRDSERGARGRHPGKYFAERWQSRHSRLVGLGEDAYLHEYQSHVRDDGHHGAK
jgi:hypothetical protein